MRAGRRLWQRRARLAVPRRRCSRLASRSTPTTSRDYAVKGGVRVRTDLTSQISVVGPSWVKTRLGNGGAELFSQCLLPKEVASTTDFYIDEIETEVLHGSWLSEFSHS